MADTTPLSSGGALQRFRTDRLESEYRIVQDKIDKIGGFRFTIRGWTVTLVTGAVLAVASTKYLSPLALLFLFVLLAVFAAIERRQNRNQQVLEDRAFEIEVEFRRIQTEVGGTQERLTMSPRIAHSLRDRSLLDGGAIRRFVENPDRWFYWVLVGVIFAAVLFLLYARPQESSSDRGVNININSQTATAGEGDEHKTTTSPHKHASSQQKTTTGTEKQ